MTTWNHTIRVSGVFHNDDLPFEVKRDRIVSRLNPLKDKFPEDWDLEDVILSLSEAEDANDFDLAWDDFYNWADDNRVWVETVG
jgi:hypothetical protein